MKHLVLLSLFLVRFSFGQTQEIDSLQSILLDKNVAEKEKAAIHLELGRIYYYLNFDSMTRHGQKAMGIARKFQLVDEKARAYQLLAIASWRQGDYDETLKQYHNSLNTYASVNDIKGMSIAMGNMGGIFRSLGKFDSALFYQKSSLKIKEELGDLRGVARNLINLALIFETTGYYDSAQACYLKALPIAEKLGDPEIQLKIYLDQSFIYREQSDTSTAIEYLEKSIEISRQHNFGVYLADATNNLGELYLHLENYDKALSLFVESYEISESLGNIKARAHAQGNLGLLYIQFGQIERGKENLRKSYEEFSKMNVTEDILEALVPYAEVLVKGKNYDEVNSVLNDGLPIAIELQNYHAASRLLALLVQVHDEEKNYREAIYWRDSLISVNELKNDQVFNKELLTLQTRFEVAVKEIKIRELEYASSLKSERLDKFRIGMIGLGLGVVLLSGLIYFLKKSKTVNHQKEELQKQQLNEKLQHKERELLTSAMLLIRKNEDLEQIKDHLGKIDGSSESSVRQELNKVIKNIDLGTRIEKDWEIFRTHFENANEGFLKRLTEKHPDLSSSEVKLSTYIKMNMSNKEIAQLNHVSLHAVEKSRSRLRKKIDLSSSDDLFHWAQNI